QRDQRHGVDGDRIRQLWRPVILTAMQKSLIRVALLVALAATGACTVHQTTEPPLAGPSDLAQSVLITATPDIVTIGGLNTTAGEASTILVVVHDASGKGQANQVVRLLVT